MKVRMLQTLATPTICFKKGDVVEMDAKEADRIVAAGQATKDLSEPEKKVIVPAKPVKEPERQVMDRSTSKPVEKLKPRKGEQPITDGLRGPGSNDNTQPSQTAASTEAQAHAEVDKHGVPGEEPSGGGAAHKPSETGAIPIDQRAAGAEVPQGEAPITTKARLATAGQTTQDTEKPLSGNPSPNAESPAPGARRGSAAKRSTAKGARAATTAGKPAVAKPAAARTTKK